MPLPTQPPAPKGSPAMPLPTQPPAAPDPATKGSHPNNNLPTTTGPGVPWDMALSLPADGTRTVYPAANTFATKADIPALETYIDAANDELDQLKPILNWVEISILSSVVLVGSLLTTNIGHHDTAFVIRLVITVLVPFGLAWITNRDHERRKTLSKIRLAYLYQLRQLNQLN